VWGCALPASRELNTYDVIHPTAELVCDGLEQRIAPHPGQCFGILGVDLDATMG